MLQTSQMLERTSLTKATSKYLLSPLTSRRKEHILLHRTKGKRTSNMAMRTEVFHVLSAGFREYKKLLQIHSNLTIILQWDIAHTSIPILIRPFQVL